MHILNSGPLDSIFVWLGCWHGRTKGFWPDKVSAPNRKYLLLVSFMHFIANFQVIIKCRFVFNVSFLFIYI